MTDVEQNGVVLDYFKRLDRGDDFVGPFADDVRVFYPKWRIATGHNEIGEMFGDIGALVTLMSHDYEIFNYVINRDTVLIEGTSTGETADRGEWRPDGTPGGGRWCDVFEVRDGSIQRLFIYLDPDYAGMETEQYPWF